MLARFPPMEKPTYPSSNYYHFSTVITLGKSFVFYSPTNRLLFETFITNTNLTKIVFYLPNEKIYSSTKTTQFFHYVSHRPQSHELVAHILLMLPGVLAQYVAKLALSHY